MLQPLGQNPEGKGLNVGQRFFATRAIGKDAGEIGDLGDPAPVRLLLELDTEIHNALPAHGSRDTLPAPAGEDKQRRVERAARRRLPVDLWRVARRRRSRRSNRCGSWRAAEPLRSGDVENVGRSVPAERPTTRVDPPITMRAE